MGFFDKLKHGLNKTKTSFDEKMNNLKEEFAKLLKEEEDSKQDLLNVFKELGYEITL